jgi:hypothetical protein
VKQKKTRFYFIVAKNGLKQNTADLVGDLTGDVVVIFFVLLKHYSNFSGQNDFVGDLAREFLYQCSIRAKNFGEILRVQICKVIVAKKFLLMMQKHRPRGRRLRRTGRRRNPSWHQAGARGGGAVARETAIHGGANPVAPSKSMRRRSSAAYVRGPRRPSPVAPRRSTRPFNLF